MQTVQYDRELNPPLFYHCISKCYTATDDEDWTNDYPISDKFRESFDNIVPRWRVAPLPAFDTNGKFIKISDFEVSLRGSLVLVYFELKHYAIKDKRTNYVTTNTFSATATQVKILERAAERKSSPYKSLLLKGPKFLSQSPSKKKEQASAVRAFHPGESVVLQFINKRNKQTIDYDFNSRGRDNRCACRKQGWRGFFQGRW